MRKALPVPAALLAASTGRGQLAWVMDTTFRTDIEWRGVSDIEFRPNGTWISGEFKYLNDAMNWPRYSAVLDEFGNRIITFETAGGGGMMAPWGEDRFYVRNAQGLIRKFYSDGSIDGSFNIETIFSSSTHGGDFHVYPDGKVLMTGSHDLWSLADTSFQGPQYCLVRWDSTGLPDPTFQHRQCQSGIVMKIWQQPDGKFLLAGVQSMYDGQPVGHILQVLEDGSIDTTFHTTIDYGSAGDYYRYPDGRLLFAGYFHTPELPNDTVQLLRLMPDGTVDHTFNYDLDFLHVLGPNVVASTQGVFMLDPATLLISGEFTEVNNEWKGGILAIDTAGNVLPDHFPGMGCDSLISLPNILTLGLRDIEQAPDGSLYAYGNFHGFDDGYINDPEQRMIVRLRQVNIGVQQNEPKESKAKVYPNPGMNEVRIEWPGHVIASWVLRSSDGRSVLHGQSAATVTTFDVAQMATGVYMLSVLDAQGFLQTLQWLKP